MNALHLIWIIPLSAFIGAGEITLKIILKKGVTIWESLIY